MNWAEIRACAMNDEEEYQIKDAIGKAPVGPGIVGMRHGRSLIRAADLQDLLPYLN
ncbi:hypothetical protein [Photorhabdus akhurstii]